MSGFKDQVSKDDLIRLRRELHWHSELALQEFHTAEIIERELD